MDVAEDPERGWLLGRSPAAAEHERGGLAGFEALLVGGLPPVRPADLAELARTYPKVMARARGELARDAVRRGWLRRVGRGQRTRQGQELALRLRSFQRELRRMRSEHGESAFDGPLLPYALHFGLVRAGELPLARFAGAWVGAFAGLPGWARPGSARRRFDDVASSRPSIDEQLRRHEDELWVMSVTGGW